MIPIIFLFSVVQACAKLDDVQVQKCLKDISADLAHCREGEIALNLFKVTDESRNSVIVNVAIFNEGDDDTYNKYTCGWRQVQHPFEDVCQALSQSSTDERPRSHPLGWGIDNEGRRLEGNPDSDLPYAPDDGLWDCWHCSCSLQSC
jgi:hypothetical protein